MREAKHMCNGLIYGFSSLDFTSKENKIIPINMTPKIDGTSIFVNNGTS